MDQFLVERVFMDITETNPLAPNETRTYEPTTSAMTGNTVTSSATGGAVVREITSVEIIPPEDANGNYEDLREVWLIIENRSTQHYVNLSGVGTSLMAPLRQRIWGGGRFQVMFGEPLWSVVRGGDNMPLRNTTFKYANRLAIAVHTVAGVTGAGHGGFRIIVRGYEYTAAQLAAYAPRWNNTVRLQTVRRQVENRPPLSFTFAPDGPLSPDTWLSYPGGVGQGAIKINPYWHFAYNALTTQPQSPFILSNFNALGGGSGHVENTFQDLGFEFAQNEDAFILRGFGIRGVRAPNLQGTLPTGTPAQNLARFGWMVNGNIIPEVTGNQGLFATAEVNDYAFGAAMPYVPVAGVYLPIPRYRGELLIYKDNAAPFIGANGSGIPAYTVCLALNGVLVERG